MFFFHVWCVHLTRCYLCLAVVCLISPALVMSPCGKGTPYYKKIVGRTEKKKKQCSVITAALLVVSSCWPSSPGTFMRLLWICSQHAGAASMLLNCCIAKSRLLGSTGFILQSRSWRKCFSLLSNKNYAIQCIISAFIVYKNIIDNNKSLKNLALWRYYVSSFFLLSVKILF